MYLEHFGLDSPPFKITPATHFFFSGANRGEILDALIYAVTESEGIIKVTGEVGSGKTMLSRMLLEQLPKQVECVYLANPSLSRDEMLHAIADGLGLNLEGQRVNVIMQTLQNLLTQKAAEGKRVVVLVDEAHAMPLETLEELRLLYNLQVGDQKLMQIALFGQPELNAKLEQPNMRQLKDRIVHHFSMLPLSPLVIEAYLLFRMRAAGYRGSNIFSAAAIKLIGKASNGLMRRVNILADKSLLAAFVEDKQDIEVRHVRAAMRDSELTPHSARQKRNALAATSGIALAVLLLLGMGWQLWGAVKANETLATPAKPVSVIAPPAAEVVTRSNETLATPAKPVSVIAPPATEVTRSEAMPAAEAHISAAPAQETVSGSLLQQRLAASLALRKKSGASIQLFYTTNTQASRMENFLSRARKLGKEKQIYLLPIKIKGHKAYRVLYGFYPNVAAAYAGMEQLPKIYRQTYAPTLFLLGDAQPG